jgi:hypothetical protein
MFLRIINKIFNKIRRCYCNYKNKKLIKSIYNSDYQYGLNNQKRDLPEIVVSLTTFPKRIDKMDLCIKSILNQSFKPDRIIIWLGNDCTEKIASKYLSKYQKYGVEYRIDKLNNYMSHKKYIYSFKEFPKSIIITLDDDLIYPSDLIYSLIKMYKNNPNNIIARRVHRITWNKENINNYNKWIFEYCLKRKPSHKLFATTGAGTLFPPNILPKEVCDYNLIKQYAYSADDIWINLMAVKNDIKILWARNLQQMPMMVDGSQESALVEENIFNGKNDEYISKIMNDYKISKEHFK